MSIDGFSTLISHATNPVQSNEGQHNDDFDGPLEEDAPLHCLHFCFSQLHSFIVLLNRIYLNILLDTI